MTRQVRAVHPIDLEVGDVLLDNSFAPAHSFEVKNSEYGDEGEVVVTLTVTLQEDDWIQAIRVVDWLEEFPVGCEFAHPAHPGVFTVLEHGPDYIVVQNSKRKKPGRFLSRPDGAAFIVREDV